MEIKIRKWTDSGGVQHLSVGVPEADDYLEMVRGGMSSNTWVNYAHDLKFFLAGLEKPLAEVRPSDIFAFIRAQQDAPNPRRPKGVLSLADGSKGLSAATIRRRVATVSSFFDYLVMRGDVQKNPVPRGQPLKDGLRLRRPIPFLRSPNRLPQVLNDEEIEAFLGSLRTHRDRAIFLLMLVAGLRKQEVADLQLADIHPGKRQVVVRNGKGGKERVTYASDLFFKSLQQYLVHERPDTNADALFVVLKGVRRGEPLSAHGIITILEYHRVRAKTPRVRCHLFRHTCFSNLCEAGMPIEAVRLQAGHNSIEYTQRYVHLSNKRLQSEYLTASKQMFTGGPEGNDGNSTPPTSD
jgi:integrase/recombinase XerD